VLLYCSLIILLERSDLKFGSWQNKYYVSSVRNCTEVSYTTEIFCNAVSKVMKNMQIEIKYEFSVPGTCI
jgi:hypothetical protein